MSSDDRTPEDLARAAMAVDPRVLRLKEALHGVCNQTDGTWAIMLARDALSEIENDFASVAIPKRI